jgi:hypothetical protein
MRLSIILMLLHNVCLKMIIHQPSDKQVSYYLQTVGHNIYVIRIPNETVANMASSVVYQIHKIQILFFPTNAHFIKNIKCYSFCITQATQYQRNIAQSHATQHQSTHHKLKSPIATEQQFLTKYFN